MDIEYLNPTKSSRFRVIGKVAGLSAAVAALVIGANLYTEHVAPLPICDQFPWVRLVLMLVGLALLTPAIFFGRAAWRIFLHRQFPPPGTAVFFRAKIQRGFVAFAHGASAALAAAVCWLLLAYLAISDTVQAVFFGANPCGA